MTRETLKIDMRIGIGYDIHRFQEGRPLILGGVTLRGETGLGGHSDADVLLHAVIDALLGAAGLGDIGQRYPPDDPAYAGADSRRLLAEVAAAIRESGYLPESVDATVIAERPKLGPHLPRMRQAIGEALGLDAARVNVKATTNEGIGAVGRGEGIAAIAVALLREPKG
jgi:2-C-methyl-D-erythritol 2,4-cyclodiphosphate synthase